MSDNISQDIAIRGEGNIVVGKGDVIITPLLPAEARLRHDLGILLKNVETTWIKGVLEKSVHQAALLELGMEIREEAVDNPWNMVMERPDQSREVIPRGRKFKDIFDEANHLLLILGEPGSGKTTTLLQLARDLIAEVDSAFTQPIPVILNLSTWTNKEQPLDEWLIGELNSKYRLPKRDGKQWLRDRRMLPLLDGLDEVKAENRAACVEKVNRLVSDYGLQGLVVCSRIKDYTDLKVRLAFYRAIYIQPLTPEQVDEYLNQAGDNLVSLRAILQTDEALRSMAQSPLILNIMSLAYQNTSAEDLSDPSLNTSEARRQQLFDTYIIRMFKRKAGGTKYDIKQTKHHLSWLARNMQRQNQEIFLIENVQPSWLQTRYWRRAYVLTSRLIPCLIIGLIIGLIFALIELTYSLSVIAFGRIVLAFGGIALLMGLALGLLDGFRFGLIGKVPSVLNFRLRSRGNLENDIQLVESLSWSWESALDRGLRVGFIIFLIGEVLLCCTFYDPYSFLFGSIVGLMAIPISAVFFGLSPKIIKTKSVPNEGVQLSIRSAILGGLIFGLIVGLILGLVSWLFEDLGDELTTVLIVGLIAGLIGALWYGGLDVIQHYTLRLILVIHSHTPVYYSRFLEYAVDCIFLQKVGGGYRFIHRLLLEHFADMNESDPKQSPSSSEMR